MRNGRPRLLWLLDMILCTTVVLSSPLEYVEAPRTLDKRAFYVSLKSLT